MSSRTLKFEHPSQEFMYKEKRSSGAKQSIQTLINNIIGITGIPLQLVKSLNWIVIGLIAVAIIAVVVFVFMYL